MEGKWREWLKSFQSNQGKRKKITWEDVGFGRLIIIVLAGIFLLVLSFPQEDSSEKKKKESAQEEVFQGEEGSSPVWDAVDAYAKKQEQKVEEILSSVEGVGEVDVMVTMAASEEKVTLKDQESKQNATREQDRNGGSRLQTDTSLQEETILIQEEEGEEPYIVELQSPEIEGIVVVAKGAGSGSVDMEIIEAIVALFPIETHKIKVMKMK